MFGLICVTHDCEDVQKHLGTSEIHTSLKWREFYTSIRSCNIKPDNCCSVRLLLCQSRHLYWWKWPKYHLIISILESLKCIREWEGWAVIGLDLVFLSLQVAQCGKSFTSHQTSTQIIRRLVSTHTFASACRNTWRIMTPRCCLMWRGTPLKPLRWLPTPSQPSTPS